MDPYLEGSAWESFHAAYIDEIGRQLAPKLRPKYIARVEQRLVAAFESPLDELEVMRTGAATATLAPPLQLRTVITLRAPQRSIVVVEVAERRHVAAIELLSPSNKGVGGGREEYLQRREIFLASQAHLIEIDLLRRGTRLPMAGPPSVAYFGFVSRSQERPLTGIWPIGLRDKLPQIPIPLLQGDNDVRLDLQAALTATYDAFGFDLELDYSKPPETPFAADDADWADALLRSAGPRHQ